MTWRTEWHRRASPPLMIVTLLATVTIGACASSAGRTASLASAPCSGREIAVVRNESGATVDIFTVEGSSESFVGTARSGRSEIALPPQGERRRHVSARTQDGVLIAVGQGANRPTRRVEIDVECRD